MAIGISTIASLATTGITAGVSFAQGLKDKRLAREAEREAAEAFAKAMNLLDVNNYLNLSIPKKDLELARLNIDARAQQQLSAQQEADPRYLVGGGTQQALADSELKLQAQAEQREAAKQQQVATQAQKNALRQAQLRGAEAVGAQSAAANLSDRGEQRFISAGKGLVSGITSALAAPGLYDGLFGEKTKKEQVQKDSATDPGPIVDIEAPQPTQKVKGPLEGEGLFGMGEDIISFGGLGMPQAGLKSTQEKGIGEVFSDKSLGKGFEYMKNKDGTFSYRQGGTGKFQVIDPNNPDYADSLKALDLYYNKNF